MKNVYIFIVSLLLTACSSTPYYQEPAIVDISDSKVVVQWVPSNLPGNVFASKNTATIEDVKRVADMGCKQYKDKKAVPLSSVCGNTIRTDFGPACAATNYLFSCTDK